MDEPTVAEEVRRLSDVVKRLADGQRDYVTKEIMDLKLSALDRANAEVVKDQEALQERMTHIYRTVWTAVVGPVIVGVILYFTLGKGS